MIHLEDTIELKDDTSTQISDHQLMMVHDDVPPIQETSSTSVEEGSCSSKVTLNGRDLFEWLFSDKDDLEIDHPLVTSLWTDSELSQLLKKFQEDLKDESVLPKVLIKYGLQDSDLSILSTKSQKQCDFVQKVDLKEIWKKELTQRLRIYAETCPLEREPTILELVLKWIYDLKESHNGRQEDVCLETVLSRVRYFNDELMTEEEMKQRAKRDALIYYQVDILQREEGALNMNLQSGKKGLLSSLEPERCYSHWDYVMKEAFYIRKAAHSWIKYQRHTRYRVVKDVKRYWQAIRRRDCEKLEDIEVLAKKRSAWIAREIKKFWRQIGKLVEHKVKLHMDDKMTQEREKHLDFIVEQTEKYSVMLSERLLSVATGQPKSDTKEEALTLFMSIEDTEIGSVMESNLSDFEPGSSDDKTDDEETIDVEETELETNNSDTVREEVQALQYESEIPLEELLRLYSLPIEILQKTIGARAEKRKRLSTVVTDDKAIPKKVQMNDELTSKKVFEETLSKDENFEMSKDKTSKKRKKYVSNEMKTAQQEEEEERKKIKVAEGKQPIYHLHTNQQEMTELHQDATLPIEILAQNDDYEEDIEKDDMNHVTRVSANESRHLLSPLSAADGLLPIIEPYQQENKKEYMKDLSKFVSETVDHAAKKASELQSTGGHTLSTTNISLQQPFLLKHMLREYQLVGLNWLVTMYERHLNGILADEMGLGKTIQTIALLAHLACEKAIWGPHLIVVPTSVILNWEMEFKKWCPAFKTLTYFGTAKERKLKRLGWSKANAFHVCITSYKLVMQDHLAFRRKKWIYLILDEAQNIKNFKSQRWQHLLHFNSDRRLLLTGTPLQNNLMELWALMHFLMPHVFASHREFQEWFSLPVMGIIEGSSSMNERLIQRLHSILRPFILRRLKSEVEQQLPLKYEHIVMCRLSKRQRYLYDEFMSRAQTQESLASGNFLSVINCLMQLRKVCNHPDLFETRTIVSPFVMQACQFFIWKTVPYVWFQHIYTNPCPRYMSLIDQTKFSVSDIQLIERLKHHVKYMKKQVRPRAAFQGENYISRKNRCIEGTKEAFELEQIQLLNDQNQRKCIMLPVYTADLVNSLQQCSQTYNEECHYVMEHLLSISRTICENSLYEILKRFVFVVPPVWAVSRSSISRIWDEDLRKAIVEQHKVHKDHSLNQLLAIAKGNQFFAFPDLHLIQYDCGKLQALDDLLRKLHQAEHRVLIFTQMSRMLDILEIFLNYHGYRYLRLDGATRIDHRQMLMEKFNNDPRIFVFILSTRSGGVGVNLTGADTVIFYDSDWNPAMDIQAQDRCHRIGQTRDVHIYRLISESTVEENILKKATQKRILDELVIQGGEFTIDYFLRQNNWKDLFLSSNGQQPSENLNTEHTSSNRMKPIELEKALLQAEDTCDAEALEQAKRELIADTRNFQEDFDEADPSPPISNVTVDHVTKLPMLELESILNPVQRLALQFLERDISLIDEKDISILFKQRYGTTNTRFFPNSTISSPLSAGPSPLIKELSSSDEEWEQEDLEHERLDDDQEVLDI
jgi:SNF2 family DNA or RNA helicase